MKVTTRHIFVAAVIAALLVAVVIVYCPGGGDPNSSDPQKRLAAVAELRGKTDQASLEVLRRLSDDSEPRVAVAAVNAISSDSGKSSRILKEILAGSPSGPARGAAAAALGRCKDVDGGILADALTDKDPIVRAGAAKGLARRREGAALPEVVAALEDPDARVRLWAITAVARTTALRFDYDAATDPRRQRDKIKFIRETLRRRSGLR